MSAVGEMVIDVGRLTPAQLAALAPAFRDAMRDKSYELLPLGQDVAAYLRAKRKTLTPASFRGYESTLDKLARDFPDLRVEDFEVPVGVDRLEEWLDTRWGDGAPGSYNVHLAHVSSFFKHWVRLGRLRGNPALLIDRARKRQPARTVFTDGQHAGIIGAAHERRDRIALRLLLDYGLRKSALRGVRFGDFDHERRRLTVLTKGQRVQRVPLPDGHLWGELERLLLDWRARPSEWLMCLIKPVPRAGLQRFPDRQMSSTAMHRWWYKRLEDAGVVPHGETAGERMHKARHTAGQRVLDATGDLKLVQRLLGHATIATTGDIYVDYDEAQFAARLAQVLREQDATDA